LAPLLYHGAVALVSIENLNIRFGATHAVRGLSLDVAAGESLGLVGESGSGKSVTALAILRLLDAAATVEGRIAFEGRDLLALPDEEMRRLRGREIAMIFQEPMTALNPVMPIGEQIAEAVRTISASSRGARCASASSKRCTRWPCRMRRGATATIRISFRRAAAAHSDRDGDCQPAAAADRR